LILQFFLNGAELSQQSLEIGQPLIKLKSFSLGQTLPIDLEELIVLQMDEVLEEQQIFAVVIPQPFAVVSLIHFFQDLLSFGFQLILRRNHLLDEFSTLLNFLRVGLFQGGGVGQKDGPNVVFEERLVIFLEWLGLLVRS